MTNVIPLRPKGYLRDRDDPSPKVLSNRILNLVRIIRTSMMTGNKDTEERMRAKLAQAIFYYLKQGRDNQGYVSEVNRMLYPNLLMLESNIGV